MLTFPYVPNHVRTRHKAAASKQKSPFFFGRQDSTNWLFSNLPKSSAHASGAWRHSHPQVLFSIWDFYFDISERHILPAPAREHLRSYCTELTHALSRKVLGLTKPKGKIYKRKSLGHYITLLMTLKFIWWWDSSSGDLGNVAYPFIAFTPKSALTLSNRTSETPL